ncbi:hypothetical protein JOC85_000390 [Bacillus mesophilus]|uniref:Abortive phage infection protein n=1 Tax=Bacillus mesophilus TaxID=1808955 RepID=A0A6M0Q2R9_9BACI|nr:abortive phage infection protein [Bacillus mesophilus]MBM7659623.1 hypothetical protein [Bacillus mesophilus]NEY70492.1 abortive phage infection protein [Bacillus mesophilus]
MTPEEIEHILDKLRNRELEEYFVTKDVFLAFRELLVKQNDFKHFRGIAQHGGAVVYTYTEEPRS